MFRVRGGLPNGITYNISSPFLNCNYRWLQGLEDILILNINSIKDIAHN